MRPEKTLSLTGTLPNEPRIVVPEVGAVCRTDAAISTGGRRVALLVTHAKP